MSPETMKRVGIVVGFLFALWTAGVVAFVTAGSSAEISQTAGAAPQATTSLRSAPAASAEPTLAEPTAPASAAPFGDPADLPNDRPAPDAQGEPQGGAPEEDATRQDAPPEDKPHGARQPADTAPDAGREGGSGGSLEGLERERAEAGVYNFVLYAYGAPTDDPVQYESLVNQAVVPSTFEASPGTAAVAEVADAVAQGGYADELATTDFELLSASGDTAEFEAAFVLKSPSGETRELAQVVEVESLGPVWKVSRAQPLEQR